MMPERERHRVLISFPDGDSWWLVRKVVEDADARACSRWFVETIQIAGRRLLHEGTGFKTRIGAESYMRGLRDGLRAALALGHEQISYWAAHDEQQRAALVPSPEPEPEAEPDPHPHLTLLPGGLD